MFKFIKKNKPKPEVDKDIQLINFLKAQNRNDLILGKINTQEFELQDAEIEAIGLRMVERRTNAVEEEVNSGNH